MSVISVNNLISVFCNRISYRVQILGPNFARFAYTRGFHAV